MDHAQTGTLRRRWALLTIVGAGLAFRIPLAILFHARQVEGLTLSYFESARNIVEGDPFLVSKGVEILHPYGYSVLILMVQMFTGSNDEATLIGMASLQVVLDCAAIGLMYVLGRNLHSHTTGLWVAAFYALNPLVALAAVEPVPESLSSFMITAILASVSMMLKDQKRWALWAGLSCGVSVHFRSEFLLLGIGIAVYLLLIGKLRQEGRRLVLMFGIVAVFLLPMVLGTWIETGTPRVNTTNAGGTMWQGLGERPENPWGLKLGDQYVAEESARLGFSSPWGPEANDHFRAEFIDAVREHPGFYADTVLTVRIPRVFDTAFQRWNYVQYAVAGGIWQVDESIARYNELRRDGVASAILTEPALVIVDERVGLAIRALIRLTYLGTLVYFLANLRRPRRILLLGFPLAYFVSLCVIKFVEPRLYFTLLPIYTFCSAAVLHQGWTRLSRLRGPTSG